MFLPLCNIHNYGIYLGNKWNILIVSLRKCFKWVRNHGPLRITNILMAQYSVIRGGSEYNRFRSELFLLLVMDLSQVYSNSQSCCGQE